MNNEKKDKVSDISPILSEKQVLDKYKQILTEDSDLMDDYSLYYEGLIEDINPKAKDLIISIYNENQSNFESLWDSSKAQVYNAIFFAAASLSKLEIYWWIEAKDKLNEAMFSKWLTILGWWKFSQLKSFFNKNWPKFEEMANNNSKELNEQLNRIAQKEKEVAKRWEEVVKRLKDANEFAKIVNELEKLIW